MISILLPSLGGGGAERAALHLARGFTERGHTVDVVAFRADGPFHGALRAAVPDRVTVTDLGATRFWAALTGFARYLRERRPTRVFAALESANLVALMAVRAVGSRARVIVAIHNTLSKDRTGEWRGRAQLATARLLYRKAAAVVAVSREAADDAGAVLRLERSRIHVIDNAVVTPELVDRSREPLDDAWFVAESPPVILGCGRLTAQKNFADLLRAFRIVAQAKPVRLLILGEGPERPKLEALAVDLGIADRVRLPGFAPNPWAYMRNAAVFALSSRYEGSPLVLVEALACGARIASADCPSGPRDILEGVPTAALVPPGDPASLASAILRLLDLSERPASSAIARFDYLRAADAYLELGRG